LPGDARGEDEGNAGAVGTGAGEGRFTSDRRLLMLALKNLVENGIKYTPERGAVRVRMQLRAPGRPGAAPAGEIGPESAELLVRVEDTGVGIPPEHLDRVFERFYQVDPARTGTNPRVSGRGTGLGLSIVKHAVNALGGTVRVESRPGQGSVFEVRLPQNRPAPSGAEPAAAGRGPARAS